MLIMAAFGKGLLYCMIFCSVTALDLTLVAESNGTAVVEACIAKISKANIFTSDQQLLRRIAYVETHDGEDSNTYSDYNNNGGIWQLSSAKYATTKTSVSSSLLQNVSSKFGITWSSSSWSDLRKPLYSALAARLYLEVISASIPLSININSQASYWVNYYTSSGGNTTEFVTAVNHLDSNEQCEVSGLDMVFVMDTSGSVGYTNFQTMKSFVYDIVDSFDVGPDSVRVGVMSYGSSNYFHFYLNTYLSKSLILSAINSLPYNGGGTNTAGALDAVRQVLFTTSNGARPSSQGIPRIAVVITDGYSNSYSATLTAANAMHNAGIIGFAIGIAGANQNELNAIASDSSYVAFISSFNSQLLSNLQVTISQEACEDSLDLSVSDEIKDTLDSGEKKYLNYPLPSDNSGITVQLNVTNGTCTLYASTVVETPNEALHDIKFTSNGWEDAYIDPADLSNPDTADRVYIVIETDELCSITVSVDEGDTSTEPVSITLFQSSFSEYYGHSVTVQCYATGKPQPTVNWYKDGILLSSSGLISVVQSVVNSTNVNKILTISSLTESDEGTYTCNGSNTLPNGTVSHSKSFPLSIKGIFAVNFTGIALSATAIFLSWDIPAVSGISISHYVVECDELETDRDWSFFAVETHANIISLHPYYSYSCRIQVVGNDTYPFNSPITVYTHQSVPITAPTEFVAVLESNLTVHLSWVSPPVADINGVLLGYHISCSATNQHEFSVNISGTGLTIHQLDVSTHYSCIVCAYTLVGCGPDAVTHISTYEGFEPPSSVTASASATTISLEWTSPFDPEHLITGYGITYQLIETSFQIEVPRPSITLTTKTSKTSYNIEPLLVNSVYRVVLFAVFEEGTGPTSEEITVETREKDTYSVQDYKCLSVTSEQLVCSWSDPDTPERYYVSGYELKHQLADGFDYYPGYGSELGKITLAPGEMEYTVDGLWPYAGYIVTLRCTLSLIEGSGDDVMPGNNETNDIMGTSTILNITQSKPSEEAVTDMHIEVRSAKSVEMSWKPPPRVEWKGRIDSYLITMTRSLPSNGINKRDADPFIQMLVVNPQENHPDPSLATEPLKNEVYEIENLEESFEYSFSVVLINSGGAGAASDPLIQTMPEAAPSGPPENVTVADVTTFSITITWNPPNPLAANGIIVMYSVKFTRVDIQDSIEVSLPHNQLSFTKQGLHIFENISVGVAAKTAEGWGPYSELHYFTTLEDEPSSPTDLNAEVVNDNDVLLSWKPPNTPNGLVIDYQVVYSGHERTLVISDGPFVLIVNATERMEIQISNLVEGYFYEFKVRARNGAGYGTNNTVLVSIASSTDSTLATSKNLQSRLLETNTMGIIVGSVSLVIIVITFLLAIVCIVKYRSVKKKSVTLCEVSNTPHRKNSRQPLMNRTPELPMETFTIRNPLHTIEENDYETVTFTGTETEQMTDLKKPSNEEEDSEREESEDSGSIRSTQEEKPRENELSFM